MSENAGDTVVASGAVSSWAGEYPPVTSDDREKLLTFARTAPFTYGTWSRFKSLYKAVEADTNADKALLGTLLARIDDSPITLDKKDPRVKFANYSSTQAILAEGDLLFTVSSVSHWGSRELVVFSRNPDDPLRPTKMAAITLDNLQSTTASLTKCGALLCVALGYGYGETTLYFVDVANPATPYYRGNIKLRHQVCIYDSSDTQLSLYINSAETGNSKSAHRLQIIDFPNPAAPIARRETEIKGLQNGSTSFAVDQGLAAFTTAGSGLTWRSLPQSSGVRFVDVSDPAAPQVTGSVDVNSPRCLVRRGAFTYVGVGANTVESRGVQIIDNSDPRHPRLAGFCAVNDMLEDLTLSASGDFLYARTTSGIFHGIDVRDPAAPVHLENSVRLYGVSDMVIAGDLAYVITPWQGTALFSLASPQTLVRVGAPPSGDTIGYMKRRGRRVLRRLRKTSPIRYVELATELLVALTGKDPKIDPARHWASIDVLYGGGNRYRQTKHGRGRYIPTGSALPKRALRSREERLPEAWDAAPEALNRLLITPDLPLPVYVFAARALRNTRRTFPAVDYKTLEQWLGGDEPLLIALANRLVQARLQSGVIPPAPLTATIFFYAGSATRKSLARDSVGGWASKRSWAESFALRLAELIQASIPPTLRLSNRQIDAGALLAQHFSWAIAPRLRSILPLVAPFTESGNPTLVSLITTAASKIERDNVLAWLLELNRVLQPEKREPILVALVSGLRNIEFYRNIVRSLVFHPEPFVRAAGWRLIAATTTPGDVLRNVWEELLENTQPTPALITAMESADALGLLERAGIGSEELAGYVSNRDFLVELLSPEAFRAVSATAPASVVLSLIAASPDAHWQKLRASWLEQLQAGIGTEIIWLAAENALSTDTTGRLEQRLLLDPEVAATFLLVGDEKLLEIRDPSFGEALGAWIGHYSERFTKNSELLYAAATHPLPEIRTPALIRVSELGMDMPFALRLMESAVPPSVAVGKTFFDAEPVGGEREPDYALALCDSPFAEVRAVGRDYVSAHWATLPHERILLALFENPAPEIQAFVAEHLSDAALPRPTATPLFDAEVLRTTNRARVAKERIKTRQTTEPSIDIPTLLTIARGRTPRDAEWALGELARRAALGEVIDGITVEGIAGI